MQRPVNPIRVLIADAGPIAHHKLHQFLGSVRGIHVVGHAPDGRAVVELVRQLKPQLLIVDNELPLRAELARLTNVPDRPHILVTLRSLSAGQLVEAIRLGANGILGRITTARLLLNSIRNVAAGDHFLGTDVTAALLRMLRNDLSERSTSLPPHDCVLTPRQHEIIVRIASGLSNRAVAQEFSISERTVKHHLTTIFNKLGVSNRLALALFAINNKLMHSPGGANRPESESTPRLKAMTCSAMAGRDAHAYSSTVVNYNE